MLILEWQNISRYPMDSSCSYLYNAIIQTHKTETPDYVYYSNFIKMLGSGCGSDGRASLTIPEVRSSNPVIGNKIYNIYCQMYWKDENKEKEAENGPFLQKLYQVVNGLKSTCSHSLRNINSHFSSTLVQIHYLVGTSCLLL